MRACSKDKVLPQPDGSIVSGGTVHVQQYGGTAVFKGNLNRHDLSKFINTTDENLTNMVREKPREECELYRSFSFITSMA